MKLVLAKCKKTGKRFCLEIEERDGREKVKNFIDIDEANASKIKSANVSGGLESADNLLPCEKCGNRVVGACSCTRAEKRCRVTDRYNLQCLYCDNLELERAGLDADKLRIQVTSDCFDDIGEVLDSMRIKYKSYNGKYDCDILFINCGTRDAVNSEELKNFVLNGGCVYISDLASSYLDAILRGKALSFSNSGLACVTEAKVIDEELRDIIGDKIRIEFDLGAWSIIHLSSDFSSHEGRVLLEGASGSRYDGVPLMIYMEYGKGKIFYTSFHNHKQADEKEKMLLQLLLLKQIGAQTNQTVQEVGDLVGLNISTMRSKFRK